MARRIVILPKFENQDQLDDLMTQLEQPVHAPVMALVAPFDSDLTNEIIWRTMIDTAMTVPPFTLRLAGIYPNYETGKLYLDVVRGADDLRTLHERLYQTIALQRFYQSNLTYIPRLTLAQQVPEAVLSSAADRLVSYNVSYTARIEELVMYDDATGVDRPVARVRLVTE